MGDESTAATATAISATITSPPSATMPKKVKMYLIEDEIYVLVSLWRKEEMLFNCKHADYHKMVARNVRNFCESCIKGGRRVDLHLVVRMTRAGCMRWL